MLAAYGIFKSAGFCSLVTLYHISCVFTLLFVSNVQELRFTKTAEADQVNLKLPLYFSAARGPVSKLIFHLTVLQKKKLF